MRFRAKLPRIMFNYTQGMEFQQPGCDWGFLVKEIKRKLGKSVTGDILWSGMDKIQRSESVITISCGQRHR